MGNYFTKMATNKRVTIFIDVAFIQPPENTTEKKLNQAVTINATTIVNGKPSYKLNI